jgi:hypothetical protein
MKMIMGIVSGSKAAVQAIIFITYVNSLWFNVEWDRLAIIIGCLICPQDMLNNVHYLVDYPYNFWYFPTHSNLSNFFSSGL